MYTFYNGDWQENSTTTLSIFCSSAMVWSRQKWGSIKSIPVNLWNQLNKTQNNEYIQTGIEKIKCNRNSMDLIENKMATGANNTECNDLMIIIVIKEIEFKRLHSLSHSYRFNMYTWFSMQFQYFTFLSIAIFPLKNKFLFFGLKL